MNTQDDGTEGIESATPGVWDTWVHGVLVMGLAAIAPAIASLYALPVIFVIEFLGYESPYTALLLLSAAVFGPYYLAKGMRHFR